MLKKNYPYKSKVVLTEKQATKEPVGSYYHPTEKTFRSGACPVGMTLQKGYHRKGYMKMNGTVINNTNVDPVCVKNKGLPGKLIKKEKDDFKEFGYLTSSNNNSRFKSLLEACVVLSYGTVIRKLSVLKKKSSKKDDNKSKKLYTIYSSDILMLQKWRIKNPDLYKVKNELLLVGGQYMFGKKKVNNSNDLKAIIQDLRNYISKKKRFVIAPKLSNLDVSEIIDTTNLFENFDFEEAKKLGYNVDISGWKLDNVIDMESMFYDCKGFNQDLSSWGPSLTNVTNMNGMFFGCTTFNQDLSNWGPFLTKVTNMGRMFYNCESFKGKGLGSWKLDNITTIDRMFSWCKVFDQDLSSWGQYLGNITTMGYMFYNCKSFEGKGLGSWGPSLTNVTNMNGMFCNCYYFNQDLSSWGPSLTNVTTMRNMFYNCEVFEGKGLDSWKLGNVTTMESMFNGCTTFNQNLSSWGRYLTNVTSMLCMFENCKMFEGKGLDSWGPHLGNVKNMRYMFKNCKSFNQNDLGNSWRTHLHKL